MGAETEQLRANALCKIITDMAGNNLGQMAIYATPGPRFMLQHTQYDDPMRCEFIVSRLLTPSSFGVTLSTGEVIEIHFAERDAHECGW